MAFFVCTRVHVRLASIIVISLLQEKTCIIIYNSSFGEGEREKKCVCVFA